MFKYAARSVIYRLSKLLQNANACPPILVTLAGIVISVKPRQTRNAFPPILAMPYGITTSVKPPQSKNAKEPM